MDIPDTHLRRQTDQNRWTHRPHGRMCDLIFLLGQSSYHIMSMKAEGIKTSCHYLPVHTFDDYAKEFRAKYYSLPLTKTVAAHKSTLPLYPTMAEEQLNWVIKGIIARRVRQRTRDVGVFPNRLSVYRLVGTLFVNTVEDWRAERHHMG